LIKLENKQCKNEASKTKKVYELFNFVQGTADFIALFLSIKFF